MRKASSAPPVSAGVSASGLMSPPSGALRSHVMWPPAQRQAQARHLQLAQQRRRRLPPRRRRRRLVRRLLLGRSGLQPRGRLRREGRARAEELRAQLLRRLLLLQLLLLDFLRLLLLNLRLVRLRVVRALVRPADHLLLLLVRHLLSAAPVCFLLRLLLKPAKTEEVLESSSALARPRPRSGPCRRRHPRALQASENGLREPFFPPSSR